MGKNVIYEILNYYDIILYTSLDMRANVRGDRPLHGRDLKGGHNAPPPPPSAVLRPQ